MSKIIPYIVSSMVGSVIGDNKNIAVGEAIINLLDRYNHDLYDKIVKAYNQQHHTNYTISSKYRLEKKEFTDYKKNNPNLETIIKEDSSSKFIANLTTISNVNIAHHLMMERGVVLESKALELVQTWLDFRSPDTYRVYTDPNINKITLTTTNNNTYILGGKIDAFIKNERTNTISIVEVKTRVKRRYGSYNMPYYDIDQICCYTQFYPAAKIFYIVEYYDANIYPIRYHRDVLESLWTESVKPRLDSVMDWLVELDCNPNNEKIFNYLEKYGYVI